MDASDDHPPPVSSMLCSGEAYTPRVAACLGGHARTFTHTIVHRSFAEHVLNALGVPVVLFAYLKVSDRSGNAFKSRDDSALVHSTESSVRRALRAISQICRGCEIGRVHIVNSSSSNSSDGPTEHPRARCASYGTRKWHSKVGNKQPNRLKTLPYLQSMLGQLDNRATCATMVARHEDRVQQRFVSEGSSDPRPASVMQRF
jgi:hypothetical protein